MIRVLQSWEEIGRATHFLGQRDLPKHRSGEKCWDLYLLHQLAASLDRNAAILDQGYKGLQTLQLLRAMRLINLSGIDLYFCLEDRLRQAVWMWREKTLRPFFRLHRGDLLRTRFANASFDLLTCVSVIEHGVDTGLYLRECNRLLRPGGLLFVTTDYWENPLAMPEPAQEYGLPWKVFHRDEIKAFITQAAGVGLNLIEDGDVPACGDRCVIWHGQEYTFIALGFRKTSA